jgi:hypothetical protein
LFDPPDSRRLRHLSIGTYLNGEAEESSYLAGQDEYGPAARRKQEVGMEAIIPLASHRLGSKESRWILI